MGGRAGGGSDFERQYNDFHRFSQKTYENLWFLVHFASDFHKKHIKSLCFIAKMKKRLRKHAKTIVFFDFSNQAGARVPIFTPKMKNSRFARFARFARLAPGNGIFDAARDLENSRRGARMT